MCKLCEHPDRESIEFQLAQGILRRATVSKELSMPVEDVHEHMDLHFAKIINIKNQVVTPQDIKETYDKRNVLQASLQNLVNRLHLYLEKDSYSGQETTQIVKMMTEVRNTAMDLAKLEGELKEEHHYTIVMFQEFQAAILSDFCETDQRKAIELANKLLTQ